MSRINSDDESALSGDPDDPMYEFYRPDLREPPRLTRGVAVYGNNNYSTDTASTNTTNTISNNSRGSTPELNTDDDLDFEQISRSTTPIRKPDLQKKNPWAYESDSEGGKSRKRRKTHRKRKTNRRH
jgi:hypothetical protein